MIDNRTTAGKATPPHPRTKARSGQTNVRRITRLLKLIQILQSGCGQNISGLGEACGVSRRTAFRDIEALRRAGMPVEYEDAYDRYSLAKSHFMPPINLSSEESLSLIALAAELGRKDRFPYHYLARTAALKLENGLSSSLQKSSRNLRGAVRIQLVPSVSTENKESVYQALVAAQQGRRVLKIEYDAGLNHSPMVTNLRVYSLFFCRHSWYAIGRSSLHSGVRTFAVERIRSIVCLNQRYVVPNSYSIEEYLGNAWLVSPGVEPDEDIVIRFKPTVARKVAEFRWHKTQSLIFEADGSLLFRATVSGFHEIVWWILGFGDQAEVVLPESLRLLIWQRARNMVAQYGGRRKPLMTPESTDRSK